MNKPTEKFVAIVHFLNERPGSRPIYYQVTIDPEAVTLGGLIRFGRFGGDEITGWQPLKSIEIDEVLATFDGNNVVPVAGQTTVTFVQS